jgi:hypothetical protein
MFLNSFRAIRILHPRWSIPAPHTPGWVWARPIKHAGRGGDSTPLLEMGKMAGKVRSRRCYGGATKPPMPRLATVEAAEQSLDLRVWGGVLGFGGGELVGVGDGGGQRGRLEGWRGGG